MSIARIHDKNVSFDPKALEAELRNRGRPSVTRRAMLRGAAACISLPMLESLLTPSEARAQAASAALRFTCWHIPCGVWGPSWFPTDTGANYTLSPSLSSLAPVKSKVLVFAGVLNTGANGAPAVDITGSHGCGPPGMTTCVQGKKPQIEMGISVDQVYAQAAGKATRIPSMQISVCDSTFADVQYPAVYNGTTSWASATQPLPPIANAGLVFDQLFAGGGTPQDPALAAALAKRKALRKSVLDEVSAEHAALAPRLGFSDRRKLDEYLAGVRAAEVAVDSMSTTPPTCNAGMTTRPSLTLGPLTNGLGKKMYDPPAQTAVLIDLMVLAFQCDATRIINFQQMNGGNASYGSCPWLGINQDHHGMSHHGGSTTTGALLAKIDAWEISMFSSFLQKLDAIKEGDRTILDNSVIFLSSEISDGNAHNQGTSRYSGFTAPTGKPILLAGSAGGKIKTGRHAIYNNAVQADLFIALMNLLGVPVTKFGAGGTMPLAGLT
jgi:hypothetical protein